MGKCEIPAHVVEMANVYYVEVSLSDGAVVAGDPDWNRFRLAIMPIATERDHGVTFVTEFGYKILVGSAPENRRQIGIKPWLLGALAQAIVRTGDRLRSRLVAARHWVGSPTVLPLPALPTEEELKLHLGACQLKQNIEAATMAADTDQADEVFAGPRQKGIGP